MENEPKRSGGVLLNAGLIVGALLLAFLLYGLVGNLIGEREEPARATAAQPGATQDILQVEVRNASGVPSVTRRATLYLRQQGFDVVEAGSASSEEPQTAVIDRVGNPEAARRVALAVGVPEDRISSDVEPDLMLDVSVVIGADYEGLKPFGKE